MSACVRLVVARIDVTNSAGLRFETVVPGIVSRVEVRRLNA